MQDMETKIEKIDRMQINEQIMEVAGEIIKQGGLVAFPTETVYGLGANALDEEAARKTYAAKGRPSDNPLIVHIAEKDALEKIVDEIPAGTWGLVDKFWPGPLTLILKKNERVPYGTTGGLDTVAVRMPDDEIALELIRRGGGYVSAPSANTSGRPSPTTAQHVAEDLDGKIDMILDGGSVNIGVESTIVDMTCTPPMILRPGAVTKDMLEEVLGEVETDRTLISEDSSQAPKAPGMKYRHYAPKAQMILIEGNPSDTVLAIKQLAYDKAMFGKKENGEAYRIGIIATSETMSQYTYGVVKSIGSRENRRTITKNLYGILREFDEEGVDIIYSEGFFGEAIDMAIMNRLLKAAGHKRIPASEILQLQKYRKIIFVSKDDNCRGPMAERLLQRQTLLQEYDIQSRGMVVLFPEPLNPKAEEIMRRNGVNIAEHEALAFEEKDITPDTLILTMEKAQKRKIITEYGFFNNILTLNEYIGEEKEVESMYGKSLEEYEESYVELEGYIRKLARKLNMEAREKWEEYI